MSERDDHSADAHQDAPVGSAAYWMQMALGLARSAKALGEVPVGAVVVCEGRLISTGFNLRETLRTPTAHAEHLAIERAAASLGRWRLSDCELFVTLEPCLMCAGLIYQARMRRVVFAAYDPKGGALGSLYNLHQDQRLNHRYEVEGACLAHEAGELLSGFFAERRTDQKKAKAAAK